MEGIPTTREDKVYDIRQKVGMVFQNPDNQIVATVVEEDVAFALENLGVPRQEIRSRVDEAMKMTGIYEAPAQGAPTSCRAARSSGWPLRASSPCGRTAWCWTSPPPCWTPGAGRPVMDTIRRLNRDYGITVVAITHYMEEAAQADRVVVMSAGRIVLEGTPKEVFSQTERVRALRLDVPQAAELREELVKAGIPMPEGIIDEEECAQALYELLK